ncbi:hypothetical protein [Brevibacterium renqingii]|uniref:hypothetical protein n=1 Tax=Brevibacterium renqingii TaxID=2776916 RepID=UPI001AE038FE|nr:hypothetical protein [Brevibacterium renqingii]
MIHAFEGNEVRNHHRLVQWSLHLCIGQNRSCWQLPRQQPNIISCEAHGSDGIGLLLGLDPDDVEAIEVAHRVCPVWQHLPVVSIPRVAEVSSMKEQDECEAPIRDLVDELTDLLVIDDDHGRFLRHKCRDPCIVEVTGAVPLRHGRSRGRMEDESGSQFRIADVGEQQTSIGSMIIAADDLTGAWTAERVVESGDVLDFTVFFGNRGTQRLSCQCVQLRFGSAAQILPDIDQLDVILHLPLGDQPSASLIGVHPWAEGQDRLRQWSAVLLEAPYPPERSRRHSSHGFGNAP